MNIPPIDLEPAALRELRRPDAPYPGVLAAGEPALVWVDAEELSDSAVWQAAASGHVLAPRDVGTGPRGAIVAFDHCIRPLREVVRPGLTSGAVVTIGVSILRAAAEAAAISCDDGEWWLTEAGRPVLALCGTVAWRDEALALLTRLTEDADPALLAAVTHAQELLTSTRRLAREIEDCEQQLFAVAAPTSVPTAPGETVTRVPTTVRRQRRQAQHESGTVARWLEGFGGRGFRHLWERMRSRRTPTGATRVAPQQDAAAPPKPSRRRPLIVAMAVAGAVLLVGLLWPQEPTASSGPQESAAVEAAPAPEAAQPEAANDTDGSPAPITTDDPVAAAAALLASDTQCAGAADCRAALWEAGAPGATTPAVAAEGVELVEDYGGVVAVRVNPPENSDAATRIIVIVRSGAGWLLRDAYDVAPEP